MRLELDDGILRVELNWWEKLLACRFSPIEVPVANIDCVSTERQTIYWNEIRMPGTFIPKLVKAGTYLRKGRRDFWCVSLDQPQLRIELKNDHLDSITLGLPDNKRWAARLSQCLADKT